MNNPYATYTQKEIEILNNPYSDLRQVARVRDNLAERETGVNPHNEDKLNEALKKRWNMYMFGNPEGKE